MSILLAPVAAPGGAKVSERIYRKQILRPQTFDYVDKDGTKRTLNFDESYFQAEVDAFRRGAFDTVPFMLADVQNRHTMEPERAAGEIMDLEARPDGLYGVLRLSESAARIVEDNPKFGVSARIKENLARGDGFKADHAIQHVLGTFDPQVTGLEPWEAVELSASDDEVIDLTATEGSADVELTDEQLNKIAARVAASLAPADEDKSDDVEDQADEMTEEEANDILAALDQDVSDEEPALALSNEENDTSIELSNLREEIGALKAEGAKAKWAAERQSYLAAGVPPVMLDKAEVLLSQPDDAIELSHGQADPRKAVREILDEARGTVDLSNAIGHQGSTETPDEDSELLAAWENQFPG